MPRSIARGEKARSLGLLAEVNLLCRRSGCRLFGRLILPWSGQLSLQRQTLEGSKSSTSQPGPWLRSPQEFCPVICYRNRWGKGNAGANLVIMSAPSVWGTPPQACGLWQTIIASSSSELAFLEQGPLARLHG